VCTAPCGDGLLAPGEECDDGANNGTAGSCCTTGCQLKAEGAACDDTDGCTAGDACYAGFCTGFPNIPVTYTVNSILDAADPIPGDGICETAAGNGVCSLRAAIQEADVQNLSLACGARVSLPAGTYQLTIPPSNPGASLDGAEKGALKLRPRSFAGGHITLTGAGRDSTIIDGGDLDRVIVSGGSRVFVRDVTIQNGNVGSGFGGGLLLWDGDPFVIRDSRIQGNIAIVGGAFWIIQGRAVVVNTEILANNGGGVLAAYSVVDTPPIQYLNISGSTFEGNVGSAALDVSHYSTVTVAGSTFANNLASAIRCDQQDGRVVAINSTISNNSPVSSCAAAIQQNSTNVGGVLTLNNVTIADNPTGGLLAQPGISAISNSIISMNGAPNCPYDYCRATSRGHNLIGTICGFTDPFTGATIGNIIGADPMLDVLAGNGGSSATMALAPMSPAIDAAAGTPGESPGSCALSDQRGLSRPQLGACDIGAYEATSTVADVPAGNDVTAAAPGATVTFSEITVPGGLTVTRSDSGPILPANFNLGNAPDQYIDISTTATYTGPLTVCIDYDPAAFGIESAIQVLHYEAGQWVFASVVSRDLTAHRICVSVSSLSPFVTVAHASECPGVPPPWADGDGDGRCDALDPCFNGKAAATKQRLLVTRLIAPLGDDKLSLQGEAALPTTPALDPPARGVQVLLQSASGQVLMNPTVPAGLYDPSSKMGWKANSKNTAWAYKGAPAYTQGVYAVQIKMNPKVIGGIKFKVKAKSGHYDFLNAELPWSALLSMEPPIAINGQCIETRFDAAPPAKPSCASSGGTVKCE